MKNTTLCYLEQNGAYLLLHRTKKEQDANHDKWIGVGGKCEENESPDECLMREVQEETGLLLQDYQLRGIVTFTSDVYEGEYMYLYTSSSWTGALQECPEGTLAWVLKENVTKLPIWEGDRIFLNLLMQNAPFFSLKLTYQQNQLTSAVLNGKELFN